MRKTNPEFFLAFSALALLASGCDQATTEAGPNAAPVEVTPVAPGEQPAPEVEANTDPGFDLTTAEGRAAAQSALGQGWHGIEEVGLVWQAENVAQITLTVPPGTARQATIYFDAFLPNPGMTLDVDVALDGSSQRSVSLESGEQQGLVVLDFPQSREMSVHTVTFTTSNLHSPSEELKGNLDERDLGIALRRVDIETN